MTNVLLKRAAKRMYLLGELVGRKFLCDFGYLLHLYPKVGNNLYAYLLFVASKFERTVSVMIPVINTVGQFQGYYYSHS